MSRDAPYDVTALLDGILSHIRSDRDKIAVVDFNGKRRVSSASFGEMIDRFVFLLKSEGVEEGDFVAVRLERKAEHIAAYIACMCVGAPFVAVQPKYPVERAEKILALCKPAAVIDDGFVDRAYSLTEFHEAAPVEISDECPLDLFFTSGSTGEPKGILHSRNRLIDIKHLTERYGDLVGDSTLLILDFAFVFSYLHIMFSVIGGCTMHIADETLRKDVAGLKKYVADNRIHGFWTSPSFLRLFDSDIGVKTVFVGGERPKGLERFSDIDIVSVYGASECTVIATNVLKRDNSIGNPLPGSEVFLDDGSGHRADKGEICLKCRRTMLKYMHLPDCGGAYTDCKNGYGVFHSGDLGEMTPDGIAVIGRMDGMVKINGQRIEPSEVEYCISKIDGVKDAVVKTFGDFGNQFLCAYYVSDSLDENTVRSEAGRRLPSYMIPAFVIRLDRMPLNASGKTDRRALPRPDLASLRSEYAEPRNDDERKLCEAFSEVLGVEKIGIDDDFIQLGGDSLKAIAVQSLIPAVSVAHILGYRTPRAISESRARVDYDVRKYNLKTGCPLSESQLNVYLDIKLHGNLDTYMLRESFDIPPMGNEEASKLIAEITETHPILKGRIDDNGGVPWLYCDSHPSVTEGEPKDLDLSTEVCSFGLKKGAVLLCLSHVVFDGTSIAILRETIRKAVAGENVDTDTGFLIQPSYDASVAGTESYEEARAFFGKMLCDCDVESGLVPVVSSAPSGIMGKKLTIKSKAVAEASKKDGVTAGAYYTAAFAYTLSRFTGRSDAVFCLVENGRNLPGLENAVGMFVKTLPIRIDCSDAPVGDFVKHASSVYVDAIRNDIYPFRMLASEFGVRSKVLFQYAVGVEMAEKEYRSDIHGKLTEDLSVKVKDTATDAYMEITYARGFADIATKIADAFESILKGMLSCGSLSQIEYVSEEDVEAANRINANGKKLRYNDIVEAFHDAVGNHPDNRFVSYLDRSYTYAESDRITDGIASALAGNGIKKGDCVAVLVPRSEWYLLCALGVLKTGAAYVPIDDSYPDERVRFMVSDSSAKAVLVTEETKERGESLDLVMVTVSGGSKHEKFTSGPISPQDSAAILYTSGTTGKPKGVVIPHSALESYGEWYAEAFGLGENDVHGLFSSYSFDAHVNAIAPVIVSAASAAIVPEKVRYDIDALNGFFIDSNVTNTMLTTQVAKMFASSVKDTTVKTVVAGGEKMGDLEIRGKYRVYDGYGPTESLASILLIDAKEKSDPSSLGTLNSNVRAYILDKERRRVPIGAIGELYVSGYQLSTGYLNRPEMNEKAFFANPFASEAGFERMYATGDFFRYLPDGTFGIIGRRDGQVKIRGNRVELTEVEACIREMPEIRDVTVQAIVNDAGGKELCAYIVSDVPATPQSIQNFIAARKPRYMVPMFVMQLDKIPLNVNGKVDRRALPKPDVSSLRREYAGPRSNGERKLCEAFSEVLGVEKIGIDDDFIQLGGDSLKAIRLASVCRSYGITIDVGEIISKRTVRALSPMSSETEDFGPYSGPIGLSPLQEMFMSSGTQEDRNKFVQFVVLECKKYLEPETLQKAVDFVTDRHDMLRAVYSDEYYVRKPGTSVCTVVERKFDTEKEAMARMSVAQESFSLAEGRLMSCATVKVGSKPYLFMAINHMVVDRNSWQTILDDLTTAYESLESGKEPSFPPRTAPYQNWIEAHDAEIGDDEKEYWKKASENLENAKHGDVHPFSLTSGTKASELTFNEYGAEPADILLTAFIEAYGEITGENRISIRLEGDGRHLENVDRTVGWFANVYPVSLQIKGRFEEDLRSVRKALYSVPSGGTGYGMLNRRHLREALPDITFRYVSNGFSYSNAMFRDVDFAMLSDAYAGSMLGDDTSFNISDSNEGSMMVGRIAYPGLMEAFNDRLKEITEHLSSCETYECPLSESQLNVYLDEIAHPRGAVYNVSGHVDLKGKRVGEIESIVAKLIDIHPVLRAHTVEKDGEVWLVTDGRPEITFGGNDGFERPFDMGGCLSRFRISDGSLSFVLHHIVADGVTKDILIRDIRSVAKKKFVKRETGFLKAYSFYESQADCMNEDEKFFDRMFCDCDTDSALVPDVGTHGYKRHRTKLSPKDSEVSAFASSVGITKGALFASAFAYTLSRFTGRSDAVFSFTDSGRSFPGSEDAVGMFVRTLAIRVDCSDAAVEEYLKRTSDAYIGTMKHGNYPFRLLSSKYGLSISVTYEYNASINKNASSESSDAAENGPSEAGIVSDILFMVLDTEDGFTVDVAHSPIYSDATAVRLADTFDKILKGMLTCRKLSEMQYVSPEDAELSERINATERKRRYRDIVEAFSESVKIHPDNILVSHLQNSYTYAEADRITDGIASALAAKGVGRGDCVVVLVPRSEWYLLCALAVLKTGAAYVPIDDSYPDERIRFMIEDSSAKTVLSVKESEERAASFGIDTLTVSASMKGKFTPVPADPSDRGVILYTSGTTGKPKGNQTTRRAMENFAEWYVEDMDFLPEDVMAMHTAYVFDMHITAMYPEILTGSRLEIVPDSVRMDLQALNNLFKSRGVTHVFITTQLGRMFASMENPHIKVLVVAGEKLGEYAPPGGFEMYDAFGPSEGLVSTSVKVVERCDASCIGRPNPNVKLYILDAEKRRVPYGAVGELFIAGHQLSKGYLNRPELNSKVFSENPYCGEPGYERLYASGDFVRYLPDGTLGIIGRRDGQIKVRGNRVELTEVDACIREMPEIRDVTVQAVNVESGTELCAYAVSDSKIDSRSVQAFVAARKPQYMVPSFVMQLDKIPLNVNGKVDRRALPKPDADLLRGEYAEPRNDSEKIICEAFAEILGIEKVGIDDDFIQLGGDSLKAIRLASMCSSLGMTVKVTDIVSKRTIRAISPYAVLDRFMGSYHGPIRLSPIQEMFMSIGTPEQRNLFSMPMLLECKEKIDAGMLQKAIDAVTAHHDALRAVYSDKNYIRESTVRVCEVSEDAFGTFDEAYEHMDSLLHSFSLTEGKLMVCSLITIGDRQSLFIAIHHMAVDDVSCKIILDDITEYYKSLKSGKDPELPARTMPYHMWLEAHSAIDDSEKEYWNGVSEDPINAPGGDPAPFSLRSFVKISDFDGNIYGLKPMDVLMTAFAEAYRDVTGEDAVSVRIRGSGRETDNVGHTVGWLTEPYPVTVKVTGTLSHDIRSVMMALNAVPRGGAGFGVINHGRMREKLPDIVLNYAKLSFSYQNDLFSFTPEMPVNALSGLSIDCSTSFNIMDTDFDSSILGTTAYPGLPMAFLRRLSQIRSNLESAMGEECPLSDSQLNFYLDFIDDPDSNSLDIVLRKEYPKSECSRKMLKDALSKVLSSVRCLNVKIEDRDVPYMVYMGGGSVVEDISDMEEFLKKKLDVRGGRMYSAGVAETDESRIAVVKISHIVVDGTSIGLLQKKLDSLLSGEDPEEDTAMFRCPSASAGELKKAEEFYDSMFSGCEITKLERDMHTQSGAASVHKSVNVVCPEGITPNALITSAVAYTLSRYTGSGHSTLSIVDSGRQKPEYREAVGLFIRVLPLCIKNADDTAEYMEGVQNLILQSMEYDYPFRTLAKKYGVGSDMVAVDFLDRGLGIEGYFLKAIDDRVDTISDITLYVMRMDSGFDILADYDSGKYSEHLVKSFLESVILVVRGMASGVRLSEIDYLPDGNKALLEKFNSLSTMPGFGDVVGMFVQCAEMRPDAPALTFGGRVFSYSELNAVTDSIALSLADMGIGRGSIIAICVPKSEWSVILPMAVVKTGAAYVPIDITYPEERIAEMMSSSDAEKMLSVKACGSQLSAFGPVFADTLGHRSGKPSAYYSDDDPFVLLYTSGTTGKPKGIIVTRGNVACASDWYRRNTYLCDDSVSAFYVSPGYAPHYDSVFAPLTCGASVAVVPEEIRMNMAELDRFFTKEKVTHAIVPSPVFRAYSSSVEETSVKFFFTPGEMLGTVKDIGAEVFCDYGQSESPNMIISRISERKSGADLGPHTDSTKIYILDSEDRQVPVGAIGEICAAGPMVSAGYVGIPGGFTENKFCSDIGYRRLRHTGDVGRYTAEGRIELFGRKDGMVKIRGNRVELTEVSNLLKSAKGVKDAIVRAVDADGTKLLCAYVVSDSPVDAAYLRGFVSERKPQFMVPSFIIGIDSIPLNVNGKVDDRALPKPDISSLRSEYAEPRNDSERKLCEAFAKVLGVEKIGIDDDFIQMGGDSLKAMKVQNMACTVSVADILKLRTPRAIAELSTLSEFDRQKYTLDTGCPLSESQLNVYLDVKLYGGLETYTLRGSLDIPSMEYGEAVRLISKIVEAHPIMKGRIAENDGVPWMYFDSYPKISEGKPEELDMSKDVCSFGIENGKISTIFSHIIFDGTSIAAFRTTLEKIIAGKEAETETGFLIQPSYDASVEGTERYESAHRFFEGMLCDCDTDLGLIPDLSPGKNGSIGVRLSVKSEDVISASRKLGVTAGAYYFAAFAYALSRFTGRSDAVFCLIENGRNLPGLENAVGMFVKTIPVHVNCDDDAVGEYVKKTSAVYYGAIENDIYPYRMLAQEFDIKSDVMFQYAAGVELNEKEFASEVSGELKEDLSIKVKDTDSYAFAEIIYSGKFAGMANRFADVLGSILNGMLTNGKLSEIQYTSSDDIALTEKINATERKLKYGDILQAFRENVRKHPDNVLVTYLDRPYSYSESDAISDGIATVLSKKGIGKGDNVAVLVPRSEWYLLCALGVLKTGAAYVPVDDSYPDERVEYMLGDSSAKAVLVTKDTEKRAKAFGVPVIKVTAETKGTFAVPGISPHDSAVILYTSGTTGRPKGATITHLAVNNFSQWGVEFGKVCEGDVHALYSSFGFDAHILPFYTAVFSGSSLDIIPENVRLDIDAMASHIISHKVTHIFLTTKVGMEFVKYIKRCPLKALYMGGEKIEQFTVDAEYPVYHVYGPTENTVFSTSTLNSITDDWRSLGIPLYNVKAYVLDKEKRRVPYGAIGELFLSGYQISNGYLNRPDLNEKAFVSNPFCDTEGYETMYATGDFFRYLSDGTLGIIGRRDGQVKIRGNRVELTEVDACIREMPEIKDVTVQAIVNDSGGKELCAYVVFASETEPQAVQKFVSDRKPQYMVPSFVMQLDKIPLNLNGKVDRRALPKPDTSSMRSKFAEPRNDVEAKMCKAYSDVLGVEKVGIDDDFVLLGGDSLKAIRLASVCRSHGITVQANDVISKRTIRALSPSAPTAEDMGSYSGPVGLSPLQEMFMSTGTPKKRDWFNQSLLFSCKNPIDVAVLQKAWDCVTDRHDMLRAVYSDTHYIREPGHSVCAVTEKKFASKKAASEYMDSMQQSLSLSEGRLIACSLIKLKKTQYLFVAIHHMAVDGASWSIIMDDLTSAYESLKDGKEPSLPPRTAPYQRWLEACTEPDEYEKEYWKKVSKNISNAKGGRPSEFNVRSPVRIPDLVGNIYGVDAVDILFTAFAEAYCDITGRKSISVRMEGHGRHLESVERTVGWFTDTYPLIIDVKGKFEEDVHNIRRALRGVPNGGIGYGILNRGHLRECLPDITFNYLSTAFAYDSDLFMSSIDMSVGRMTSGLSMGDTTSFNITDTEKGSFAGGITAYPELPEAFISKLSEIASRLSACDIYECPMTERQKIIYYDSLAHPSSLKYMALTIVDAPAENVRRVLRKLIDAHPIIRARIELRDGMPWIVTDGEPEMCDGTDGLMRPFDMEECLSRIYIGDDRTVLAMHLINTDATSRRMFIGDVHSLLEKKKIQKDLGFLKINSYEEGASYAARLESERFYDELFRGYVPHREVEMDSDGKYGSFVYKLEADAGNLNEIAKSNGTTLGSLFMAAFAKALSEFTGNGSAVFVTAEQGRPMAETAMGRFARMYPLRIDCQETEDFIRKASETHMKAMSFGHLPCVEIINRYKIDTSVFYEYLSNYNDEMRREGGDEVMRDIGAEGMGVIADLMVVVESVKDSFVVSILHTDVYSDETCRKIADIYGEIVKKIAKG